MTIRAAALLLAVLWPLAASAHERRSVGDLQLVIGWGDEPAMSGFRNAVEVDISDAKGVPVTDLGPFSVDVSFGGDHVTLPLQPAFNRPGKVRAWIVPTRPGTYSFHITGTVRQQAIDVTSTCGKGTFACVTDATDLQFPVKDPTAGQLADRLTRGLPRAEAAASAASTTRGVAIAALAIAIVALGLAFSARKGRHGPE